MSCVLHGHKDTTAAITSEGLETHVLDSSSSLLQQLASFKRHIKVQHSCVLARNPNMYTETSIPFHPDSMCKSQ